MRTVLAWTLLLVGVLLGASGAIQHGPEHSDFRAASRHAAVLASALEDQAEARREDPTAQAPSVRALRAAGTFSGDLARAARAAAEAVPPVPSPTVRLLGWLRVGGPMWALGVLLIGAGAWLARVDQSRRLAAPTAGQAEVDLPTAVREVLHAIDELHPVVQALPLDAPSGALRERLDRLQDDLLTPVVDARGQLVARHGLSNFAMYFGAFSAGERNLARAWSALTDGHTPTAAAALRSSHTAFTDALVAYERAEAERQTA